MSEGSRKTPANLEEMMAWVSTILAEFNAGLLIYHLEKADTPESLRLLYANDAASEFTGADLSPLVGKYILDAFPGLADGDLPDAYTEVAQSKKSLELGTTSYGGDGRVEKGFYSVKAFPMPNDCVGVLFENITVRKQVEDMVRRERDKHKRD